MFFSLRFLSLILVVTSSDQNFSK